jgi:hypothetical protein
MDSAATPASAKKKELALINFWRTVTKTDIVSAEVKGN